MSNKLQTVFASDEPLLVFCQWACHGTVFLDAGAQTVIRCIKAITKNKWKNTGFFFHNPRIQYFLSLFLSSLINLSLAPLTMPVICLNPLPRLPLPHHNQCHLSLHPPFHSYPICLLFFRSPAQLISLHLPSRPHTHTAQWPVLTRYKHTHAAVPTSSHWPLHARLCG